MLVKGLCEQYGVSEPALLATLRQQLNKSVQPNVVGIRAENGWCCLNPAEIKWIEAAGDYMCVQTLSESYVVRTTLCELLKRLESRILNAVTALWWSTQNISRTWNKDLISSELSCKVAKRSRLLTSIITSFG